MSATKCSYCLLENGYHLPECPGMPRATIPTFVWPPERTELTDCPHVHCRIVNGPLKQVSKAAYDFINATSVLDADSYEGAPIYEWDPMEAQAKFDDLLDLRQKLIDATDKLDEVYYR